METTTAHSRIQELLPLLESGLLERTVALRLCFIAALAGESVFLYGPPGTAKSMLARKLQFAFQGAVCFDYLMGRFSTPEELFGPVSIAKLRDEDRYERRTKGYLPDADIVFLDEVWKAGPPIQNALLTALNEKIWRNGDQEVHIPLKCLIGASNETSSDVSSLAFWDRFLIRIPLGQLVLPANFRALLNDESDPLQDTVPETSKISMVEWLEWQASIRQVQLGDEIIQALAMLREHLPTAIPGLFVSDRRWKKAAHILRSCAFVHGRMTVHDADLLALPFCLWNKPDELPHLQELVESCIARIWYPASPLLESSNQLAREVSGRHSREKSGIPGKPIVVDDEYFVVIPQGGQPGLDELRIWSQDFLDLGAKAREIDLFHHRDGMFLHSETALAQTGPSPWTMQIGNTSYTLLMSEDSTAGTGSAGTGLASPGSGGGISPEELKTKLELDIASQLSHRQAKSLEWQNHALAECGRFDHVCADLDRSIQSLAALSARFTKVP